MGIFKGLKDAKPTQGGNYERAGHYLERIDKVKTDISRKKAEFLVIEKTIVRVMDNGQGKGHSVGESISHMFTMKPEYAETTLGNIKSMIAALLQIPPEQVTDEVGEMISSERQPLAGMLIEVNNQVITTKRMTLFTQVRYIHSIAPAAAIQMLTADEVTRFFPNNFLEKQAAALAGGIVLPATHAATPLALPVPQPILAPAPITQPSGPIPGVVYKLPVGSAPAGYDPAPPGWVFASMDGGRTWTFVAA